MKKFIITLLALLCLYGTGNAQVSYLTLGYCDGNMNTSGTIGSSEKDIWVQGAIYVPASAVNVYAGNSIDSIRAALASKLNIDTLDVWLRSSLDGPNLASGRLTKETTPAIAKGWNRIALSTPYKITGDNTTGLYIGYSYHQKGSSFGLSVLPTPTKNGLFIKLGAADWQDRSAEGVLCVEAMIFGDKLPKLNLTLKSIDVQPVFVIDKGVLAVTANVKNIATQTVTGFDFTGKVTGMDDAYTVHVDSTLAYNEEKTITFTLHPVITSVVPDKREITISISKLNEGIDANLLDNALVDSFAVVQHDYTHNIIIEEFTTERCPNCPRVAGYMHEALAKDKYAGRAFAICHHSGFYTDWLTATCDDDYLWFYNAGGSTYAPGVMVDRKTFEKTTPVFCPTSEPELEIYMDNRLANPAYASVNIKASVDANDNHLLHVNVTGERSKADFTVNPARMTVFIVENNIKARNQAGADDTYTHQHVTRAVNTSWGEELQWNDNSYDYSCDFTMSDTWNKDNLDIIAFIGDYDANDAKACTIANCNGIHFSEVSNGIGTLQTTDNSVSVTAKDGCIMVNGANRGFDVYDIVGNKVADTNLVKGVYLVNVHTSTGNITRKIILK
jgi:hypothetical protein